jgi:uncharacterized phage protein (TIGR01671 family)
MREILFRGGWIKNGEWIEGYYVFLNDTHYIIEAGSEDWGDSGEWFQVVPKSVGQFTGLVDKNGKKIFEGDIVLRSGITWLIAFEKNAFVCKDSSMKTYFALWEQWEYNWKSAEDISPSDAFEVIGNIYNNPELLV